MDWCLQRPSHSLWTGTINWQSLYRYQHKTGVHGEPCHGGDPALTMMLPPGHLPLFVMAFLGPTTRNRGLCKERKERGLENCCHRITHVLSVLTAAARTPHSCIQTSTFHLVPKMEVSDSCAKPQNDDL